MTAHTWPSLWTDLKLAAIDVETTGFDADAERIIEIGIVTFQRGEILEEWGSLVNPRKPIPAEVQELTGIDDAQVADAPFFEDVADEVMRRLEGVGICAYNLRFDRKFVDAELHRCGFAWPLDAPTLDPLIFARELHKEERSKRLGDVAARLGINLENAHRATDDAKVAGLIMMAFGPELPAPLEDILVLQAQWEQQQEAQMAAWKSRRGGDDGPSAAQRAVSVLGARAVGLGPAYLYGEELDPLRALYMSVPEINR